jgi:hypothetical protein
MNKLLQSLTQSRFSSANQDNIRIAPNHVETTIKIDIDTWRYFENLDEDSRTMMAHVLADYVRKQG